VLGNKIVVMTRRPGRMRESGTFDLPRPRDITSPAFNDANRRVLALIREESMRVAQVA
jgi:NitT/TauT family transport system ATP-binding protein